MKGRRQLSVNTAPHNIQQPQHGAAILLCDSSQVVVGRDGLIPDTTSTNSSSVLMSLSGRAQAAMQVPQPQDWQRHG